MKINLRLTKFPDLRPSIIFLKKIIMHFSGNTIDIVAPV